MEQYVITITRQFGSLGRPIAKKVSELLGIEYYDRDIVDAAAQKLNLPVSIVSSSEETADHFFGMKFPLGTNANMQNKIFNVQQGIIQSLVEKGSCIIVGRCSDFILAGRPNCMHIYIYAPYEARLKNCVEILKMEPEEAKKMISDVDKARNQYHKRYANYLPADVEHKDLLINSSFLGIDGSAEIIAESVRKRFQG